MKIARKLGINFKERREARRQRFKKMVKKVGNDNTYMIIKKGKVVGWGKIQ